MELVPNIAKSEAARFASQWSYNGVAIVLDDVHHQYATDFANIVLRSFIDECKKKAAAALAASKVVTTD